MRLIICRHAEPAGISDISDSPLSPAGESQAVLMGRFLRAQGFEPGTILTSGVSRAQRTAEIVAGVLGVDALLLTDGRLGPDSNPEEAWESLQSLTSAALVVTHEPIAAGLCSVLLTGDPDSCLLSFKHCTMASLYSKSRGARLPSASTWRVEWLLGPAQVP